MSFESNIENRIQDRGELTTKTILLLKTYLESGCNKKLTAQKLNKSYSFVYNNLNSEWVRNIFKHILIEKGITFDSLALKLKEGLSATKLIRKGKKITAIPDYYAREKYIGRCLEAFEVIKYNSKVEDNRSFANVTINFRPESGLFSPVEEAITKNEHRQSKDI